MDHSGYSVDKGPQGKGRLFPGGGESQGWWRREPGFNLLKTEEEGTSLGHAFEGRRKVVRKREGSKMVGLSPSGWRCVYCNRKMGGGRAHREN